MLLLAAVRPHVPELSYCLMKSVDLETKLDLWVISAQMMSP